MYCLRIVIGISLQEIEILLIQSRHLCKVMFLAGIVDQCQQMCVYIIELKSVESI